MDRPDAMTMDSSDMDSSDMDSSEAALEAFIAMELEYPAMPPKAGKDKALMDKYLTTFLISGEHDDLIAEERREALKMIADRFRLSYSYGSSLEQKTFVWPGGTHSWEDKSSGIVWVGVHGMDSICVVTRTGVLDMTRVHRDLKYLTKEAVLFRFRKTVISEIEDLASPSSKLHESFGQNIPKPFSVVSVIRGIDNESGHEAASSDEEDEEDEEVESSKISSDEYESNEKKMDRLRKAILKRRKHQQKEWPIVAGYDEKKTIKFLREQMRRDTTLTNQVSSTEYDETKAIDFLLEKMKTMGMEAFTVDETIKTAISAFQHLFKKKFEANEIEVTVMDPSYFVSTEEADCKDIYVKELEMSDIEEHLAVINEPGGSIGSLCVGSSCRL